MPQWTPGGSFASQQPLSFNDIGRQAMPTMQGSYTPITPQGAPEARGFAMPAPNEFATTAKAGRPYSQVGQMSLNLVNPGTMGEGATQTRGFIEGLGAGAGRIVGGLVGGFFGQGTQGADIGGNIGQGVGSIAQVPLDIAGKALGALPAIPGLSEAAPLLAMNDEAKAKLIQQAGGNPWELSRLLSGITPEDWQKRIAAGEVSPLLQSMGPVHSLGDQVMQALGLLGLPSTMVERAWAGGPGNAIKRVMDSPVDQLTPEVQALRDQFANGELTQNQMLDRLATTSAGYSDNWIVNTLGEMVLDPANLLFGAGEALGAASKAAKAAQASKFGDLLSAADKGALATSASEHLLSDAGRVVAPDAVTPMELMTEAQRTGQHGGLISQAASSLDPIHQLGLSPAIVPMQRVADVAQKVLNPASAIGVRGSKPLMDPYLSREATKASAKAFGLGNYSAIADRFAKLGKGDLFDTGMGYFSAQEGLFMAGETLADDVKNVRHVASARPTDVALARAHIGSENYAQRLERWIGSRAADVARVSGDTPEQALARAEATSIDKLQRMGLSAEEAAGVTKGLDAQGHSMIDAMYYGHRISTYNDAMRGARETLASMITGKGRTKERTALQNTVDRLTLIGPRELTAERAGVLRESIKAFEGGDLAAAQDVRKAVAQYDRLSANFLAFGEEKDSQIVAQVKDFLDTHEKNLTKEVDQDTLRKMPQEIITDANRGDGYVYGLRPQDGEAEWRAKFHPDTGEIEHIDPWIDIVGDAAQPWNLRFHGDGTVNTLAGAVERSMRFMGQQITTDRIDREARRNFVEQAMVGYKRPIEGKVGSGITYNEGRGLYQAVKDRAVDASTTPRGLRVDEYEDVVKKSTAAQRVGISGRDLQDMSLRAFAGNAGTVGLTQRATGQLKIAGQRLPFLPPNAVGEIAERLYPMIRFAYNPFFQLQEWAEPWFFSGARGVLATHGKGWTDPITGAVTTATEADRLQQHLMDLYVHGSETAQFDTMERSMTLLAGQKAAKQAEASVDRGLLRRGLGSIGSTHERKMAASSKMFRYFLGPMLKEQFDQINPNIWLDLEKEFGTVDHGTIAMRWLTEKDPWAQADPKVAYHLMDIQKEAGIGARAAVDLESNAKVVFKTSRDALNTEIKNGTMTHDIFHDTMVDAGAHPTYIDNAWRQAQWEAKVGGIDGWWKEAAGLAAGGEEEVKHVRSLVQALAAAGDNPISEAEYMSRRLAGSPVSLLHDDLISASADDVAAWGVLLQQGQEFGRSIDVASNGAISIKHLVLPEAEAQFLKSVANTPQDIIDNGLVGRTRDMQRVTFGKGGRDVFIPGGLGALRDIETPWTSWEAHVIRAQVLNPEDLKDPALEHALFEKMWRGHTIDMADPENVHAVFNNFNFALHSAQMSLTRNEMIATRFHVTNRAELQALAQTGRSLRATIERKVGRKATPNELGLAYGTERHVANHIPLDSRWSYYHDGMLPARDTIEAGETKHVHGTQDLIEKRAAAAIGMLEGSSQADRARYMAMEAEKKGGPLENWSIEQIAKAVQDAGGIGGIDALDAMHGVKRAAKFTPEQAASVEKAANDLVEALAKGEDDEAARKALAPFAATMRTHDKDVVFKDWNVNGAGLPRVVRTDGTVAHVGNNDLFAYLKNDDVSWRSTGTNGNMGRSLLMAQDMVENPQHYVRRADEPLDQFGERISHRTEGLQLKTGFFGADLGDPMNFNRGVHDIHMVGDMTEWMWKRTKQGTTPEWTDWLNSLSKAKGGPREFIEKWVAAEKKDGPGSHHGAGAFKWTNAAGVDLSLTPGKGDAARLAEMTTHEKATWVRDRIDRAVANEKRPEFGPEQRDRLYQMYRDDAELAELVGRDITTYGGDYKAFEDKMTLRKSIAEKTDPYLKRHGNGGYQWKLWDDRRHVWDPEATAFASSHALPRRPLRFMASSDDAHNVAGFLDDNGQPSVFKEGGPGYSYLDPIHTMLFQKDGRLVRGATISLDDGQKIIGLTQYRNRSTLLHEITHALIEPNLDPSGRQVVLDDLNRVIDSRNADVVAGGARYEKAAGTLTDAVNAVNDATSAAAEATAKHVAARGEAQTAIDVANKAESEAARLAGEVKAQQAVVAEVNRAAGPLRKAAQKEVPSVAKRRLETIEGKVADAQGLLDHLTVQRDAAAAGIEPAREAARVSRATADAAKAALDEASTYLKDQTAAHRAAKKAFDEVATTPLQTLKTGWDREVSEHFADEFGKWVATGKASSPGMRDAFAYFRKVLISIYHFAKGQDKVSPEMEQLFRELTTPKQVSHEAFANAVPFNATHEIMHAAGIQSVVDAENAAFTNVQFRRSRSWLERSINHPYLGIYPSSYMWGKVAPEIIRGLSVNPFGLPIPILTKPVKLGAHSYGLHGTPYWGFVNAQRVWNSVEMQKDTDPKFNANVNDPKNQRVWQTLNQFIPATPWDIPANFPLWSRRVSEFGLQQQQNAAQGRPTTSFDVAKTGQDVAGYAFGLADTFGSFGTLAKLGSAPIISGKAPQGVGGATAGALTLGPNASMNDRLSAATQELQQQFGGAAQGPPQP